jgi:hypothetical protein
VLLTLAYTAAAQAARCAAWESYSGAANGKLSHFVCFL